MSQLRITEIFYSLQGEGLTVGVPTVFVRLTGCPLRCTYCDTSYAFRGGQWMDLSLILEQISQFKTFDVMVTGGEPLAQDTCIEFLTQLCDAGYRVSLETSGAVDIERVDPRVVKVMDLKTPSSGEVRKNLMANIPFLTKRDQLKFVITDRADYEWSCDQLKQHKLDQRCTVLFSPVADNLEPHQLADWILEDHLPVRFQIQLHKYLWGNVAGK